MLNSNYDLEIFSLLLIARVFGQQVGTTVNDDWARIGSEAQLFDDTKQPMERLPQLEEEPETHWSDADEWESWMAYDGAEDITDRPRQTESKNVLHACETLAICEGRRHF